MSFQQRDSGASERLLSSRLAARQRLRGLQVFSRCRQRVLGETRYVVIALRLSFELRDVVLVIRDHVFGEFLIEGVSI